MLSSSHCTKSHKRNKGGADIGGTGGAGGGAGPAGAAKQAKEGAVIIEVRVVVGVYFPPTFHIG